MVPSFFRVYIEKGGVGVIVTLERLSGESSPGLEKADACKDKTHEVKGEERQKQKDREKAA